MFLSDKQLVKMTGRKRPSAQIRVLSESGINFRVVDGRPVVPKDQFNQTAQIEPRLRLVRA